MKIDQKMIRKLRDRETDKKFDKSDKEDKETVPTGPEPVKFKSEIQINLFRETVCW